MDAHARYSVHEAVDEPVFVLNEYSLEPAKPGDHPLHSRRKVGFPEGLQREMDDDDIVTAKVQAVAGVAPRIERNDPMARQANDRVYMVQDRVLQARAVTVAEKQYSKRPAHLCLHQARDDVRHLRPDDLCINLMTQAAEMHSVGHERVPHIRSLFFGDPGKGGLQINEG